MQNKMEGQRLFMCILSFSFSSLVKMISASPDDASISTKTTAPFYTASSMLPHLQNQEFFNAIESRYSIAGPFAVDQQQQIKLNFQVSAPLKLNVPPKKKFDINVESVNIPQLLLLMNNGILLIDVRSFVKYSQLHICTSINIAAPNTILKRPSFTLEKVSGVIISEQDRRSWENSIQNDKSHIVFYDQQSENINDNSAIYYLCLKLREIGHQGMLGFLKGILFIYYWFDLQSIISFPYVHATDTCSFIFIIILLIGGMSAFFKDHPNQCTSGRESSNAMASSLSSPSVPPTPGLSGLPPVVLGSCLSNRRLKKRPIEGLHLGSLPQPIMTPSAVSFTNDAFNPFFSNIRQNMELCHGSIKERFPVRFPNLVDYDPNTGLVQFSNTDQKMRDCSDLPNVIPPWMRKAIDPELGPKNIAESYEVNNKTIDLSQVLLNK